MTTSRARGLQTLKGALVCIDPITSTPRVIAFTYNPETLKRTLQPELVGGEEGDRSQAVRFKGAPSEVVEVEVEIDATDLLEKDDPVTVASGIFPQLATLELLAYPRSSDVAQQQTLLAAGTMEIAPLTAPLVLLVWGRNRVVPVRINSYTISEEAFDANLNPIRASVTLSMRVLNYSDLNSSTAGYHQFLAYQQNMETRSAQSAQGSMNSIGSPAL